MVVLSDDIVGAFPAWAKAQPRYADLHLDNIVVVTLPQPMCMQMIRTGAVALGNLTLDVSRGSGFYPDIFMGYPEPLRQLRSSAWWSRRPASSARIVASRCWSTQATRSGFGPSPM